MVSKLNSVVNIDQSMRRLKLIMVSILALSCGTKSGNNDASDRVKKFQGLLSNLRVLEKGYVYDVVNQDTEDCYIPSDSLFYNPPFPILGHMNDGVIYSLIHFEPGDDMYPVIQTFDNNGVMIARELIVFGTCAGWDCDFDECDEKFTIIDSQTIENVVTLVATPCDSLGKKDPTLTKKSIRKKVIRVDKNGKLHRVEEGD